MAKQWYIVHTYSGFEDRVRENLRQRIDALGVAERFDEIKVPAETLVEMRNGKKKQIERKLPFVPQTRERVGWMLTKKRRIRAPFVAP